MVAPTRAPSLPQAALMPLNVERHSAEYTRLGRMNVVVLGPKFAKKNVSPYKNTRRIGKFRRGCQESAIVK